MAEGIQFDRFEPQEFVAQGDKVEIGLTDSNSSCLIHAPGTASETDEVLRRAVLAPVVAGRLRWQPLHLPEAGVLLIMGIDAFGASAPLATASSTWRITVSSWR